ncbi:unnamed protein product [Closterium sp. NIES-64]|nr:unnamed protein product [Closterium sp. NIES-64]
MKVSTRTVSTQFDWAQGSCSVKVDGEFRELPQWSDGATSSTDIINVVRVRQPVKRAARIVADFLEEVEVEEGKGGSATVGEKATLPADARGARERVELAGAVAEEVGAAGGVGVAVEVVAGVEVLVAAVEAEVAAEVAVEVAVGVAGARVAVAAVAAEAGVAVVEVVGVARLV